MGLKKRPGLAGGPDIEGHHIPSQALGWGGGHCPSVPLLQRKDGYWGDGDMTVSSSASCLFHTSSPRRLGWEGSLIPLFPFTKWLWIGEWENLEAAPLGA